MKKFWGWITNLFRTNKEIMQLAVMSIAGEYFKANPAMKPKIRRIIDDIMEHVKSEPVSDLGAFIKDKINRAQLDPPELALALVLIDSLSVQIAAYFAKQGITGNAERTGIVMEALSWIRTMALA